MPAAGKALRMNPRPLLMCAPGKETGQPAPLLRKQLHQRKDTGSGHSLLARERNWNSDSYLAKFLLIRFTFDPSKRMLCAKPRETF
jgi:hypothetical protein